MSFSKATKQELIKVRLRSKDARHAELIGLTHACAALIIGRASRMEYTTESYDVGKHIASLASSLYNADATLALRETGRVRQTVVTLTGTGTKRLLQDAGLLIDSGYGMELANTVPEWVLLKEENSRAFLRGAFLGAGSVSDPKRGYHLEIVCRAEEFAKAVLGSFSSFDCGAKMVRRNQNTVVYLKDGDRIFMFLALMGASASSLEFEDVRAEKELRNYINRKSNCETANIGKTVNASAGQIEAIRKVLKNPRVKLSPKLREAAELRLNNPELSLTELGELSGIGKSGINHRLRRIIELAEKIT